MSVVDRIRAAMSGETTGAQPRSTERTDVRETSERDDRNERNEAAESRDTRLYRCDPCGTTYVSTEMDACSRCDADVERVPTEQDLGLV